MFYKCYSCFRVERHCVGKRGVFLLYTPPYGTPPLYPPPVSGYLCIPTPICPNIGVQLLPIVSYTQNNISKVGFIKKFFQKIFSFFKEYSLSQKFVSKVGFIKKFFQKIFSFFKEYSLSQKFVSKVGFIKNFSRKFSIFLRGFPDTIFCFKSRVYKKILGTIYLLAEK